MTGEELFKECHNDMNCRCHCSHTATSHYDPPETVGKCSVVGCACQQFSANFKAFRPVMLPLNKFGARLEVVCKLLLHSLRHMHCTEVIWDNTHIIYACWNCNGKRSLYVDFPSSLPKE